MNTKVVSFQPSVQLTNAIGRIVFKLSDGTTYDADGLEPAHFSAVLLTLQATPDAYLGRHEPTGTIYVGSRPDSPGA